MKVNVIRHGIMTILFGLGLTFSGCSSTDEDMEDDQTELSMTESEETAEIDESLEGQQPDSDIAELAEAMDQLDGTEEEQMEVAASSEGLEEEESASESTETIEEDTVAIEEAVTMDEITLADNEPEESEASTQPNSLEQNEDKWAPEGNTGESFKYIINRGDTVSTVAEEIYGSHKHWKEIADASGLANPDLIYPGSTLRVPILNERAREFKESYSQQNNNTDGEQITITVEAGDTLSSIAHDQLGDSNEWSQIYGQNRFNISDPDVIHVGQVLTFTRQAH